ncbi:MAG: helix-turn-helix domain-containing protein [Gemmatimonadaceae bacterium]
MRLSRATVAGVCGISAQYLGEIERGQANPTVLLVSRLSRILGFKLKLLVTDAGDTVIGQSAGRLPAGGGTAENHAIQSGRTATRAPDAVLSRTDPSRTRDACVNGR